MKGSCNSERSSGEAGEVKEFEQFINRHETSRLTTQGLMAKELKGRMGDGSQHFCNFVVMPTDLHTKDKKKEK